MAESIKKRRAIPNRSLVDGGNDFMLWTIMVAHDCQVRWIQNFDGVLL
jgi:hypothetical protein